jgi:hypothetical protein
MVDEIDYWFEAGWAVFKDEQWDADSFPPLNDMESTKKRGVWFQLEANTELIGAGHDPHPDGKTLPLNVRRCCALDYQTPRFLALSL